MLYRPAPVSNHAWTPERVDLLRKLWADGNSGGEIAQRLGMTRNAVIGKVHRLKLPARITVVSVVSKPKSHGAGGLAFRINKARKNGLSPAEAMAEVLGRPDAIPLPEEPEEGVDVTHLVGLLDLGAGQCKWPHGDPLSETFGFCGSPRVIGKPYCEEHCRRAYPNFTSTKGEVA
jgi:GcrA cell cycle regulator